MILVMVEHDRGDLNPLSLGALSFAKEVANGQNSGVEAVLIGEAARPLADHLSAFGVGKVHLVLNDGLDDYAPEAWAHSLKTLADSLQPRVLTALGSDRGGEVMAHVAARYKQSLVAQVTKLEGDKLQRIRWGGSLLENATLSDDMKLVTVAPHSFATEPLMAEGSVETVEHALDIPEKDFRVKVSKRIQPEVQGVSLEAAEVVVSGGRGVGSQEGFALLEELADLLGGAVGCSRAVTSLGWRPHSDQVGQTGTRVTSNLYFACGISGATQHLAGCASSKHILAINTDPDAPIIAKSNYAVIGDLKEVLPAISAEVRRVQGS